MHEKGKNNSNGHFLEFLILYQFLYEGLDSNSFWLESFVWPSVHGMWTDIYIPCDKHSLVFNIGDKHCISWFCTNSYMKVWIQITFWQETVAWPPVDGMWGWFTSHVTHTLLYSKHVTHSCIQQCWVRCKIVSIGNLPSSVARDEESLRDDHRTNSSNTGVSYKESQGLWSIETWLEKTVRW